MTTDNRVNEPTPEQVEVAAVASINSHRSRAGLPTLATLDCVPNADEWRDDARAALVAAQGAAPQAESEPMYSLVTRQWSGSCPCVRAEQVDPECEWHGRPEFRIGGIFHHDAPGVEIVTKAARVLHVATCCKLNADSEHQEPQNEDMFTAGVVLNSVPLTAPVLPSSGVDEDKLAEYTRVKQAEALEAFAEKWATADGMEALMLATDAEEAVMATEKELLARAAEYREGKNDD